jgi:glucosylceramidase
MTENLIIGATRNWAKGVILWNLALDEKSGPHLGGCGNCRGVVTIDQATGVVTRNVEYYALAHASKFVEKGAVRIASASSNDGLLTVAFRNPDKRNRKGSTIRIAYNKSKTKIDFGMTQGKNGYTAQLQPGAVATFQWVTVD